MTGATPGIESFLRQVAHAYSERDLVAIERLWADAATLQPSAFWGPPGTTYHGRAGIMSHAHHLFGRLGYLHVEPMEARELAGYLMVRWRTRAGASDSAVDVSEEVVLCQFDGGRILRLEGFATEAEALGAASRPSSHEGRALFQTAPSAMVVLDERGCVVDANDAASMLFGLSAEELWSRSLDDFAPPDLKQAQRALWEQFIADGELRAELVLVGADGVWQQVEIHARTGCGVRNLHVGVLVPRGESLARPARRARDQMRLTAREQQVLELLASGQRGVEVAERLMVSPETVRTHVQNAVAKLGARNRAHALVLGIVEGEIDVDARDSPEPT